jgi:hypothetical protein
VSPLIDIDLRIAKLREEIANEKAMSPTVQIELTLLLEERANIIEEIGRPPESERRSG